MFSRHMEHLSSIDKTRPTNSESPYILVWVFIVRSGLEEIFKEKYGPNGVWANFFNSDPAYIRTELLQDSFNPQRFLTIDFWVSKEAYELFLAKHHATYERIDAECEALTEKETFLGTLNQKNE